MSEEYNGWSSYETWLVNLWLTNDHDAERFIIGAVFEATMPGQAESSVYKLASYLRQITVPDYLEANGHEFTGLASDLVTAALGRVNWDELAAHYWEDYGPKE